MKTNYLLLLGFMLVGILGSYAQPNDSGPPHHSLFLAFTSNYSIIQDHTFSRVARSGFPIGPALRYVHSSPSTITQVQAEYLSAPYGPSTIDEQTGTLYQGGIFFSRLHTIGNPKFPIKHWFGGTVRFDMEALIPDFAFRYGWDILVSLYPAWQMELQIAPSSKIIYYTDLSILGVLWRPGYQGFTLATEEIIETEGILPGFFENAHFSSLHNTLKWNNQLTWHQMLSENFSIQFLYGLNYFRITTPRLKQVLRNQFQIGLLYQF